MRMVWVAVLAVVAAPALAQGQRLPRISPAEQTYTDINRSLQAQESQQRQVQQNQFELNQLRQDLSRQQVAPPIVVPGISRNCPPGSLGC
jgi:hypothetical protein